MALLQVKTSFNIDLQFETAPFHLRFIAWLIDFILLYAYIFFMNWLIDRSVSLSNASEFGLEEILIISPLLLYHILCELFINGQSIGKLCMRIKVVGMNGQAASASQYILRWLFRFVDFGFAWAFLFFASKNFMLGGILMLGSLGAFIFFVTSTYNQRLGDVVAGTVVVLKKLPYSIQDTIFTELNSNTYQVRYPMVMKLSDKDINVINNILKQHYKSNMPQHIQPVAEKIKSVLHISTDEEDVSFLETLMHDYNYLSRQ